MKQQGDRTLHVGDDDLGALGRPVRGPGDELAEPHYVWRAGRVGVPLRGRPDAGPGLDWIRARLVRVPMGRGVIRTPLSISHQ